ncbi:MAG: ATP-binding cassette domain-containing protein, partial [Planctomycetaceae bacterium]|nr:ATP-binding cassette domain-containing protein [Planctomycetaceae bacterium]
ISGTIVVDSCDVCHMSEALRRDFRLQQIGMVFQDFQLINYLSVVENVLLPCRLSRKSTITAEQRTRATDLLASVGLADKSKRPVTRLSQGERQRVAICRALIRQPSLILADEPTGNLDPVNSRQILELLIRQARAVDATLLMVTHDHGQLDVFDRRIEMEQFFVGSQAASGEQCPC